jgi:hypothetical protein
MWLVGFCCANKLSSAKFGLNSNLQRILTFEAREEALETEVEEARTKNLYLRNTLKKLDKQAGQKETLADSGLALIDFEQLKIENQVHRHSTPPFLLFSRSFFPSVFSSSYVAGSKPLFLFFFLSLLLFAFLHTDVE